MTADIERVLQAFGRDGPMCWLDDLSRGKTTNEVTMAEAGKTTATATPTQPSESSRKRLCVIIDTGDAGPWVTVGGERVHGAASVVVQNGQYRVLGEDGRDLLPNPPTSLDLSAVTPKINTVPKSTSLPTAPKVTNLPSAPGYAKARADVERYFLGHEDVGED